MAAPVDPGGIARIAKFVLDLIEGLAIRSVLSEAPPGKEAKQVLWAMLQRSLLIADEANSTDIGA